VVTEKSSQSKGQYTFDVPLHASKTAVRHAVFHAYGILPQRVSMLRRSGKYVRYGRATGRTADRKKAVVTLPPGKTIEVFSA
jgi:large subunit ribosomal protein L23